ncbi:tRNA (adenosine(37)-N6)-threonylcarbamoyltransferase complex ATPase subunit type 1 TsaE [Caldicoprobacter algeriensis]|uniref:tRNA (adenosine(37)-N6)-threonylcarbamoyltransferase complex ATPase subunit type 1 TsaE n=1 Tax=Caldicoprobacter algeriensis TaxID=699281 RepID=UPI002079F533|nr:tRNA (adenosine(37)-N6)-threonylcarbamoyltransferase complex ATPase subunit type 1 TsaE [Caldicoprobacter algeriensis]MCM8900315.1 tRNA (adenosine(37)-N6)-threonylcarbamoyltransferase complex ATPase subunit type 1 TsaE [Caldicoprobacter algeriensis]
MAVFVTHSEQETMELGIKMGKLLEAGDIVLLYGDLGAGKTVLTRGLVQGLGAKDVVTSPTYTLMHRYEGRVPVFHFDLYRLCGPDEVLDLGYEEFFYGDGVSIVEWPERLEYLCPEEYVRVRIEVAGDGKKRRITVDAVGGRYSRFEKELKNI